MTVPNRQDRDALARACFLSSFALTTTAQYPSLLLPLFALHASYYTYEDEGSLARNSPRHTREIEQDDGYSEHEPVLSGHVSSTADVPNMATRVTNVVHRAMQPGDDEEEAIEIDP